MTLSGPEESPGESADTTGVSFKAQSIAVLAYRLGLQSGLDRPVVDLTALKGLYDYKFDFNVEGFAVRRGEALPGDLSPIFKAVEESLGLKLDSRAVPVMILTIDSASKEPAAN